MNFKTTNIEDLSTHQQIDLICERLEAYKSANPDGKLSYSGGRDSHLLFIVIRQVLGMGNDDFEAVYINTKNEFKDIRNYLQESKSKYGFTERETNTNCLKLFSEYGLPLFGKQMSKNIYLYLRNNNSITKNETLKKDIINKSIWANDSNIRCSDKCCYHLKEKHLKDAKITGLRVAEKGRRALWSDYDFCVKSKNLFKPIFDLSDKSLRNIEKVLKITPPNIYCFLQRTGCVFCGYGTKKQLEHKILYLQMYEPNRYKFYVDYFNKYLRYRKISF